MTLSVGNILDTAEPVFAVDDVLPCAVSAVETALDAVRRTTSGYAQKARMKKVENGGTVFSVPKVITIKVFDAICKTMQNIVRYL